MWQIVHWYINNRLVSKKEAEPPIKAGKNWTPRLVADYTYHKEIKEAVENSGLTDPHERIAEWSRAVFEKYNSLSDEERAEFAVIAEKWKKEGPPQEVKQQLVYHFSNLLHFVDDGYHQ